MPGQVEAGAGVGAIGGRLGLGERATAGAAGAGDAEAVYQDRRAGLQHSGLEPVAVMGGDAGVVPQADGGQLAEVLLAVLDMAPDRLEPGVGPLGRAVAGEPLGQALEVADRLVARPA